MSFEYFSKRLNYTLANEDSSLELKILPQDLGHIVSVAGSGARVLPLFAKFPREVTCVDLSPEQLMLTELRIEAARVCTHSEYLSFFGYPGGGSSPEERKRIFSALHLSSATKDFFLQFFTALEWGSLLYLGRWEKTFKTISRIVHGVVGEKVLEIFQKKNLAEQRQFMVDGFPDLRWRMTLFALGRSALFNALLYRGHFPTNNVARSYFRFYEEAFNRIFVKTLAKENFFLQVVLYGELRHAEGNPIECQKEIYTEIQKGIHSAKVHYEAGNVLDWMRSATKKCDFLSFSDVPSYFSDDLGKAFMRDIAKNMAKDSLTVVRSYMHRPMGVDLTGYENVTERYAEAIDEEKTQMYFVDVYKRGI